MGGVGGISVPGTAPRILIVDDDDHIQDVISMALSDEGFDVATAENGKRALELAQEQRPSVIILDMWMPVMDGWQFLREYRRRPGPHAPVIALTATQFTTGANASIEAHQFLPKPFSLDSLLTLVNLYTGRSWQRERLTA